MSGVLLSTIFDFGKLRLLKEEVGAVDVMKKKRSGDGVLEAEVEPPEILWMKSGDETGPFYRDLEDSDEGESVDSDSDTITNEIREEEEEEGIYEEENGEEEEGIFEWEMSTILEETEDEEEEDEDEEQVGEKVGEDDDESGIDLGMVEPEPTTGTRPPLPGSTYPPPPDEHEQRKSAGKGISTQLEEKESGESGTPAGDSEFSTLAEDRHNSTPKPPGPSTTCDLQVSHTSDECGQDEGPEVIRQPSDNRDTSPSDTSSSNPFDPTREEEEDNRRDSAETDNHGGTEGMHSTQARLLVTNNNGPDSRLLRSVLRKPGNSKGRKGRCVTFNESLNLFYDAECSCWVHEDDYARYRQEEYERREREELYQYEPLQLPIEYDEPPTLSPPEGYKDRFFPQEFANTHSDPDVTRVSPPSPPTARRKVFLRDPAANGQEEEPEEETSKKRGLRLGGILKGGRLWRSNSSEGKKVISPPEEPDVVKCTESSSIQTTNSYSTTTNTYDSDPSQPPTKVSIGTAPLRTSEQIRLAVDSTLRSRKNKKPECSTLVEKLRWLTSLEDEDSDSNQSGFATWPSPRDKNGVLLPAPGGPTKKSDAGTCTNEEHFVVQSSSLRPNVHEAKIKQISYTLEDIEEGLKGTELELESFISRDGGRMERIRKRYGDEEGDDYGFSRRPSVKGIKPKFSSTNQIFAQFTNNRKSIESPALGMSTSHPPPPPPPSRESEYENTRLPAQAPPPPTQSIPGVQSQGLMDGQLYGGDPNATARTSLSYEFQNTPGRQTEESRAHFELIRQSFESATSGGGPNFITNYHRPHSWSVSTLPHPHHNNQAPPLTNHHHHLVSATPLQQQQQQQLYGTVRRVPNVIGRPLFLHYGALSVEAHPSKIPAFLPQQQQQQAVTTSQVKVPETPSPTQQMPAVPVGMRYYGPPIRYYNQPPPVPPRTVTAGQPGGVVIVPAPVPIGINNLNMPPSNIVVGNHAHPHVNVMAMNEAERGVPEGSATDEEQLSHKETYSMNV